MATTKPKPPPVPPKKSSLTKIRSASLVSPAVSLDDEDTIRRILIQSNLSLDPKLEGVFFKTCQELEAGRISNKEFCSLAKSWIDLGWLSSLKSYLPYLDLLSSIEEAARKIEARAKAKATTARYLSSLVTARDLEPESVKIVTVVQEIVEAGFDDHEVTYLSADSCVIRNFVAEEVIPFVARINQYDLKDLPLNIIRVKRAEIKEKLSIQRKNVNVHLQRAESGVAAMHQDTYHIKTNHLPRYAAAVAQEIVLRSYHILLGASDPEDIMIEADVENLQRAAVEHSTNLQKAFAIYAQERVKLVSRRYE